MIAMGKIVDMFLALGHSNLCIFELREMLLQTYVNFRFRFYVFDKK